MFKYLITFGLLFLFVYLASQLGWITINLNYPPTFSSPVSTNSLVINQRKYDKFAFEYLETREYVSSPIVLQKVLKQTKEFTSYLFTYQSDGKIVSGMATLPIPETGQSIFPAIIMLRGFVDQEIYQTGVGTWKAAEILAQNDFITFAPDFLGYGESDSSEGDILEERFNKPVQILNLIASLETLTQVDVNRIGIWGHSNGGQIALSILEITKKRYPTTLWAPVSKPFPYSVLFYSDEVDDYGQFLRFELAKFEKYYNVNKYSITEYLDQISAPIILHQGSVDDSVPKKWSDNLAESLKSLSIDVTYHVYPNSDHNMSGSWDTVVQRDVDFFKKYL